jgi:hypothetical protein
MPRKADDYMDLSAFIGTPQDQLRLPDENTDYMRSFVDMAPVKPRMPQDGLFPDPLDEMLRGQEEAISGRAQAYMPEPLSIGLPVGPPSIPELDIPIEELERIGREAATPPTRPARRLPVLASEEPEPVADETVPPGKVAIRGELIDKDRLDALAGKRVASKRAFYGGIALEKYLPWMDPDQPGLSEVERSKRLLQYGDLSAETALGVGATRESMKRRLSVWQGARQEELLGTNPEARMWDDVAAAAQFKGIGTAEAGLDQGQPKPPAPEVKVGLLHPAVASMAWGLNINGLNPDRTSRGIQRLTRLSVNEGATREQGRLYGFDFERFKQFTGKSTLPPDQSIFLLSLAERARADLGLEQVLESPEIRRVFLLKTPYGFDGMTPEAADAELQIARSRAMAWLDDAVRKSPDLGNMLEIERDEKGVIIPASFAEDPEYWRQWSQEANLGDIIIRAEWAAKNKDYALAQQLMQAHSEREVIRDASFLEAMGNVPQSAGRTAVGILQFYFSAVTYFANQTKWGLEYLGDKAAGAGHQADLDFQKKQQAAQDGLVAGIDGTWGLFRDTALGGMKAVGLPTMTDREFARWKLEAEHDPVGIALTAFALLDGCFRVGGAAINLHRVRTDGALAAIMAGQKKGSAAYKKAMRFRNLLKGAGAAADLAGRPLRAYRAKKLTVSNEEWLKDAQPDTGPVAERIAAINEALKTLTDSAEDVAIRGVLDAELKQLGQVDQYRAALEASTSRMAADPTLGPWLKRWLYPPSKQQLSADMQSFVADAKNRGHRKAAQMDALLRAVVESLVRSGVPLETARIWASHMEQGIGQFAGTAAWDVARPYGRVAEQAIEGARGAGGKLKIGKVEYDLAAMEAQAAKEGIDIQGVVHNALVREMDAYKPKIVLPPDFERMVSEGAARHRMTEGQFAYKWLVWEMDRVAHQGRVAAGAAWTPDGMVAGPTMRIPELRVGEGGVRHFEWEGTSYQVRPSVVKGATGYDAKYSVWGPAGEVKRTRAKKPDKALRNFLGEQLADTGATRRYYTQALELPEITGVAPEAVQFALATDWALGQIPGKVAGVEAGQLMSFYNALLKNSPLLKSLPGGTWARHSIALETLRQLHPKMYLDPAIPKDAAVSYATAGGASSSMSMVDVFKGMGKRVEDRARYRFEAGLKLAEQGLIPIESLGKMGLQYAPRLVLPEARRASGFLGALRRFAAEDPKWTGIPTDVRAAFIQEIERGAIGREALPKVEGPTQGPQTRQALHSLEMDPVIAGVEAKNLPGGRALRQRQYLAETRLPGKTGEELFKRVYETGAAADAASFAITVMSNNLADMVGSMRSMGAYAGTIISDLVAGKTLSAEATKFLSDRIGNVMHTVDPAARLSMVMDLLRQTDAVILPPELRERLAPHLKAAGFDEPILKGLGDPKTAPWKQGIVVNRQTQYALEHIAGPALTQSDFVQSMAGFTSWIKGNQIVYQIAPWTRDMVSNWAILGPVAGLMPHSRAWSIAMQLAETDNPITRPLMAEGQAGGPLTETAFGVGEQAARRGIRAQSSQLWSRFRRDFNGELAGKNGPAQVARIGMLFVKTAAALTAAPGRTALAKFLSHQRGMTDFGARVALLTQKLAKEVAVVPEYMNHLLAVAKKYGVRPMGNNPFLFWANEEVILGTAGRIADAAWKQAYKAARKRKGKGYSRQVADEAMSQAYDEVFAEAWKHVDGERASVILDETIKAFVDYNDKPKIVDALSKTPFGPIYITWSSQMIPRVAGFFLQNPAQAMAFRGLYEVFANTNLHSMQWDRDEKDRETLRQFEKASPPWQLGLPFTETEFTGAEGETMRMFGALDASFLQPFSVNLDMVNPLSAPATTALLEASQLATAEGGTPRSMFPLKDHYKPGGPPLVEPSASGGMKALQLLMSQWAKVEPGTSPAALLRAFAGHAWGDSDRGVLETGPLPAGYSVPSSYAPLVEAVEGPRKPEQPVAGVMAGIARMVGMRVVPGGEAAAAYRLLQPEEYAKSQRAQAEARGERPASTRSAIGYAKQEMHRPALAVLDDFSAHLEARQTKAARKGTANIVSGGEAWRDVERDEARLQRANALYKRLTERGDGMLDTFRAGALHAYRTQPASELWFRAEDIEHVCEVAKTDVAYRMAEVMEYVLTDQEFPRAAKKSDVPYEVLDKAALEYVYEPLNVALNFGFSPDSVRGGRMVTMQQVADAAKAEAEIPFKQHVRRYAAEDRTDRKVQRFLEQTTQKPEAPIRAKARRGEDTGKPNILMVGEPLQEEQE